MHVYKPIQAKTRLQAYASQYKPIQAYASLQANTSKFQPTSPKKQRHVNSMNQKEYPVIYKPSHKNNALGINKKLLNTHMPLLGLFISDCSHEEAQKTHTGSRF